MNRPYEIWYMKKNWFVQGICGKSPNIKKLGETHIHLLDLEDEKLNLDQIFAKMQAENWSPNGEASDLIKSKGLGHTSMTIGDIVKYGGLIYMIDIFGFKKL